MKFGTISGTPYTSSAEEVATSCVYTKDIQQFVIQFGLVSLAFGDVFMFESLPVDSRQLCDARARLTGPNWMLYVFGIHTAPGNLLSRASVWSPTYSSKFHPSSVQTTGISFNYAYMSAKRMISSFLSLTLDTTSQLGMSHLTYKTVSAYMYTVGPPRMRTPRMRNSKGADSTGLALMFKGCEKIQSMRKITSRQHAPCHSPPVLDVLEHKNIKI